MTAVVSVTCRRNFNYLIFLESAQRLTQDWNYAIIPPRCDSHLQPKSAVFPTNLSLVVFLVLSLSGDIHFKLNKTLRDYQQRHRPEWENEYKKKAVTTKGCTLTKRADSAIKFKTRLVYFVLIFPPTRRTETEEAATKIETVWGSERKTRFGSVFR